jgi:MerR family copper efflux transcriptional regulator
MKVSELARRAGVTPTAIRFYEGRGVLPPPSRAANGYREYDERDLQRVRMFHTLRSLGLSLAESARLADMCADGACEEMDGELLPQLGRRRAEIAAARAELDHLDTQLAGLEDAIRAGRFREQSCACNHEEGDATCASCQC